VCSVRENTGFADGIAVKTERRSNFTLSNSTTSSTIFVTLAFNSWSFSLRSSKSAGLLSLACGTNEVAFASPRPLVCLFLLAANRDLLQLSQHRRSQTIEGSDVGGHFGLARLAERFVLLDRRLSIDAAELDVHAPNRPV
jgi:hypothetical protein